VAAAIRPGVVGKEAEMAIDTLAYVKSLEAAGLDRRDAEAQVSALATHVLPELVSRDDLDHAIERLEHELKMTIERAVHQQSWRLFGMVFAIVGLLDAVLFALLRVVPPPH
jgi:hypothetical protein